MFSIGFLTLDIIIVIALAILFFFFAMIKGGKQLLTLTISIYISSIVFSFPPFPFSDNAGIQLLAFLILTAVIFFLSRNSIKMPKRIGKKPLTITLLILGLLTMLFTLYYHVLPINKFYTFTLPFDSVFTSMIPVGILYLIPIIFIFLANRGE